MIQEQADAVLGHPVHPDSNVFVRILEWLPLPEMIPGWVVTFGGVMLGMSIFLAVMSVLVMFCVWLERKVSGHIRLLRTTGKINMRSNKTIVIYRN